MPQTSERLLRLCGWSAGRCPEGPESTKGIAMDIRIELILVPVTDVDRAKSFYADQVGFVVDHDVRVSETLRFVQLTPPGSACSIAIGEGIIDTVPGSMKGIQV